MLDEENLDLCVCHAICNYVWRSGNNQLARAFDLSHAADERVRRKQPPGLAMDRLDDARSSTRVALTNVIPDRRKFDQITSGPGNAHGFPVKPS